MCTVLLPSICLPACLPVRPIYPPNYPPTYPPTYLLFHCLYPFLVPVRQLSRCRFVLNWFFIVWRVKIFICTPPPTRNLNVLKCPGFWFLKKQDPPLVYPSDGIVSEPWSYSALNDGGEGGKCVPQPPLHTHTHTHTRTHTHTHTHTLRMQLGTFLTKLFVLYGWFRWCSGRGWRLLHLSVTSTLN
jgi:hypothetical protein